MTGNMYTEMGFSEAVSFEQSVKEIFPDATHEQICAMSSVLIEFEGPDTIYYRDRAKGLERDLEDADEVVKDLRYALEEANAKVMLLEKKLKKCRDQQS